MSEKAEFIEVGALWKSKTDKSLANGKADKMFKLALGLLDKDVRFIMSHNTHRQEGSNQPHFRLTMVVSDPRVEEVDAPTKVEEDCPF